MKTTLALVLALAARVCAQSEPLWINQWGTSESELVDDLVPDGAGGVLAVGSTEGSLHGPSAGGSDVFVTRIDGEGNQVWGCQFGSDKSDVAVGAAPDGSGGVFITGGTSGDLGGPRAGESDVFLARVGADGKLAWVIQFGSGYDDSGAGVAPDGSGGVFIAGSTWGALDGENAGSTDAFLARYSGEGERAWLIQYGTPGMDTAGSPASDGQGGVFLCGWTEGDLGGPNAGIMDGYLARYDAQGKRAWLTQFGTSAWDGANALAFDGAGALYITGPTNGSLGGPKAGGEDIFVARYNTAGGFVWVAQMGSQKDEAGMAVAADGAAGVFVAGWTAGDLGGPNAGVEGDAVLARLDQDGAVMELTQFGTGVDESALALLSDAAHGVFVAGSTEGDLGGPNAGKDDAYLARFSADCDGSGSLDLFDFLCFTNLFNAQDERADCVDDAGFDLFDFLCFVNQFNEGC